MLLANLIFLCISLIVIRSQTVLRYNLPGNLVSISGNGNVIVIVNITSGKSLTILRKVGLNFE